MLTEALAGENEEVHQTAHNKLFIRPNILDILSQQQKIVSSAGAGLNVPELELYRLRRLFPAV